MRITEYEILSDLKREYITLRHEGMTREAVVIDLARRYHNELTIGTEDDGLLFWIGLADAQYSQKELSDEIASRGLAALECLAKSVPTITPGDLNRRRDWYMRAPMPERKFTHSTKRYRCKWLFGDAYAYQLQGPEAEKEGFAGDYIILRKVDESMSWDARILPIVTLIHWKSAVLPTSNAELAEAPLLKLSSGRLGSPRSKYEYRVEIQLTNSKQLEKLGLKYLGNFANIPMPEDEFYNKTPGYMLMLRPEQFETMLSSYCKLQEYYCQG